VFGSNHMTETRMRPWLTSTTGASGGAGARPENLRGTRQIRITHRRTGELIAQGPVGLWGIAPFEGNLYIRRKYLKTDGFRPNWIPGLCIYKFLYVYLDLRLADGSKEPSLGWLYWLPNPLLPFIAFRPAVSRMSPALCFEEFNG